MYEIELRNENGNVVVFTPENNVVLTDVQGTTSNAVDIARSQGYAQVGETVHDMSIGGKTILFEGVIPDNVNSKIKELLNLIVPQVETEIVFGDWLHIKGYPETTPDIVKNTHSARFQFAIYCPYPYWTTLKSKEISVGGTTGTFEFPLTYEEPHVFGTRSNDVFVVVHNEGNVPSRMKIVLFAGVPVLNPRILNVTSNKRMELMYAMGANEQVVIDTTGDVVKVKTVYSGEERDITGVLTRESEIFSLEVGDNVLKLDADVGVTQLDCVLITTSAYTGAFYDESTHL